MFFFHAEEVEDENEEMEGEAEGGAEYSGSEGSDST